MAEAAKTIESEDKMTEEDIAFIPDVGHSTRIIQNFCLKVLYKRRKQQRKERKAFLDEQRNKVFILKLIYNCILPHLNYFYIYIES